MSVPAAHADGCSDIEVVFAERADGVAAIELARPGGAAEKAGLSNGDVIVAIDGLKVGAAEAKRIRELERELARKDKALAEAAALLVLQKKFQALMGAGDDDTEPRNGR